MLAEAKSVGRANTHFYKDKKKSLAFHDGGMLDMTLTDN